MARSRILKSDFFKSRSLAKCSLPARLTYIGLWTEADDKGRGIADARVLKGSLWPLDDAVAPPMIASHLLELERTAHIQLYTSHDDVFYRILKWEKHQAAAYRRGEAKYPDPDDSAVCTLLHADECRNVPSFSFGLEVVEQEAAAPRPTDVDSPAVDNSGAADAADLDDFDKAVLAAIEVRRSQTTITDERRWLPAARNGIIKDYGQRIRQLLDEGHEPEAAGQIAMGRPPQYPPTPTGPRKPIHPVECECDGNGWISDIETNTSSPCLQTEWPEATVHQLRVAQ